MNKNRCISSVLFGLITMPAFCASMCVPNIKSASYAYVKSEQGNKNRGSFIIGTYCSGQQCQKKAVLGESHCSTSGVYPASKWESNGAYCWCRFTHVRAPNGYLAPFSGAWVLLYYIVDGPSACATDCAADCAYEAKTCPGFRRALFASLIPNNKTTVLPNSAGLCNQTKYGQYQEGQNHRISFDTFRIMACSPSNCCGNV